MISAKALQIESPVQSVTALGIAFEERHGCARSVVLFDLRRIRIHVDQVIRQELNENGKASM